MLLLSRYIALLVFGMYAGVWRYASTRDALRAGVAVAISEIVAAAFVTITQGPLGDFSQQRVRDRRADLHRRDRRGAIRRARDHPLRRACAARAKCRRVLIVGAGRTGRSLLRELRETPGERVVGFVDDASVASRATAERREGRRDTRRDRGGARRGSSPSIVFVTIPGAPREQLDGVVRACEARGIDCRFVRRDVDLDPQVILASTQR